VKRLKGLGLEFHRQAAGSHEIRFNPALNRYTTIPNHPGALAKSGLGIPESTQLVKVGDVLRHRVPPSSCRVLRQDDRINMPPIVGLAAMGHAPVTEEFLRVCVSAGVDVLDRPDAGRGEPCHHIAGEIEHEMLLACG